MINYFNFINSRCVLWWIWERRDVPRTFIRWGVCLEEPTSPLPLWTAVWLNFLLHSCTYVALTGLAQVERWELRADLMFAVASLTQWLLVWLLPQASTESFFWCPGQWILARFVESQRVVIRARIFFLFLSPFLWRSTDPVPGIKHQGCVQWLRYWRSVQMLTEWLFFSLSAWFKAISLAFWDRDWAQIISFSVTTVVPAYLIPFVHNCFY